MNKPNENGLYQKQPGRGRESVNVHYRLDLETNRQLLEAVEFLEKRELSYSQSVLVRAALRDLCDYIRASAVDDPGGIHLSVIERKLESARCASNRRGARG